MKIKLRLTVPDIPLVNEAESELTGGQWRGKLKHLAVGLEKGNLRDLAVHPANLDKILLDDFAEKI